MSGIELKTVNPVVFDDKLRPDYCENTVKNCQYLHGGSCNLFTKDGFPQELKYDWLYIRSGVEDDIYKKCQECKDHCLKNKPVEKERCKFCGKEVDKSFSLSLVDGLGRWYCNKGCADSHFKSKGL